MPGTLPPLHRSAGLHRLHRRTIKGCMSGEPDNLVLVYLQRIDQKLDRLIDDVQDLKHRVTSLEGQVAGLQSGLGSVRSERRSFELARGCVVAAAPSKTTDPRPDIRPVAVDLPREAALVD